MNELFNKSIQITSGFGLNAASPLDTRYNVNTKTDLNEFVTKHLVYDGMQAFVKDEKKLYIYKDSAWQPFDKGVQKRVAIKAVGDVNDATSVKEDDGASEKLTLTLKKVIEAGKGCKLTVNEKGLVTKIEALTAADIPNLTHEKITDLGDAALLNKGVASGNVVVVQENGKIADSLIPKLAITDVFEVQSEAEMLLLDAQEGDIAIRSDLPATFILKAPPAKIKANWIQLATPTDAVLSVNGKTGTVVLTTDNIAEGKTNQYYTETKVTSNFKANITKTASTDLSDGVKIYRKGEMSVIATDINQDSTHRFVSDTEKANYADKYTKAEIDAKLADTSSIVKVDFNATDNWTDKGDNIYELNINADGKYPLGSAFKKIADNRYSTVAVDIISTTEKITVVSNEKFEGYLLISKI